MERIYFAKSPGSDGKQVSCGEHLHDVASRARKYGEAFGQSQAAELAAQLHDFGKYSARFQGVLQGTYTGIDHALGGAAALLGMAGTRADDYVPVIEAVNGHHDGLLEIKVLQEYCRQSVESTSPLRCNGGKEAALAGEQEYSEAFAAFRQDFPDFRLSKSLRQSLLPPVGDTLREMLYTRLIFSCLVDADYTASAEEEQSGYEERAEDTDFDPALLLERMEEYRGQLTRGSTADGGVNALREELFLRCGEAGEMMPGLFTLTAPTGTGKTLALLHFALRHCLKYGKRRVILVLPFLTLAEQNTAVYARIVNNILADHSQSELGEEARELAKRWSAPFIVTTSVNFFESLFAQKPAACRKLHNIAESVVIFDEAQSLPPELTATTLRAINELCGQYGCTMLFSTATQPDFSALPEPEWKPREINPNYDAMYHALRRTKVAWRLEHKTALSAVAEEMRQENSVCAIVNRRDHAGKLFHLLGDDGGADAFFLSSDKSPAHRLATVNAIRLRQEKGLPCRVVATQCMEAGVDLDFDVMYRELAPLDAIIQAAGRCNRNGRLPRQGRVIVFEADEEKNYPGVWYANAALLVKQLRCRHEVDIHDPACISEYYRELFRDAADSAKLTKAIAGKDYAKTAEEYRLIKKGGLQVLVPVPDWETLYARLRSEALEQGISARWMREASPITVATFDTNALTLHGERLRYRAKRDGVTQPSDFFVLLAGHEDCYTEDMGLQFREATEEDNIF